MENGEERKNSRPTTTQKRRPAKNVTTIRHRRWSEITSKYWLACTRWPYSDGRQAHGRVDVFYAKCHHLPMYLTSSIENKFTSVSECARHPIDSSACGLFVVKWPLKAQIEFHCGAGAIANVNRWQCFHLRPICFSFALFEHKFNAIKCLWNHF